MVALSDYSTPIIAPLARWSCRIALFSTGLLLVTLVLHRATSFSTAAALNLFEEADEPAGGELHRARPVRAGRRAGHRAQ